MVKKKKRNVTQPIITLDKPGVETFAGETSSEVARGENLNTRVRERVKKSKKTTPPEEPTPIDLTQPEKKGVITKALETQRDIITSPKTTVALTAVAAALTGFGLATGALAPITFGGTATGGSAVITRTATTLGRNPVSVTTQRAFAGQPATSGIDKIFHAIRPVTTRFASNTKSINLSTGYLLKRGLQGSIISFIIGIFGSYPFAAWAKQEVLSGLKINTRDAISRGDFEIAEAMIALREEVGANSWWKKLPYQNVIEQFQLFFKADKLAIEGDKRAMEKSRGEVEFEGTSLGEDIAIRDEERDKLFEERQTQSEEDFQRRSEEIQEGSETRNQQFQEGQEARDIVKNREFELKAQYFALIRDKKFEEADLILQEILKGGTQNE